MTQTLEEVLEEAFIDYMEGDYSSSAGKHLAAAVRKAAYTLINKPCPYCKTMTEEHFVGCDVELKRARKEAQKLSKFW